MKVTFSTSAPQIFKPWECDSVSKNISIIISETSKQYIILKFCSLITFFVD